MVKHRKLEKSAAAAVHKIQAEEDKSAASSDSALLAITSVRVMTLRLRHTCLPLSFSCAASCCTCRTLAPVTCSALQALAWCMSMRRT